MLSPQFFGAIAGSAIVAGLYAILPAPDYLKVWSMEVVGEQVFVDRSIRRNAIADWRVSVVRDGKDGPSCQTIPGQKEHEGWSHYKAQPRSKNTLSFDVWVGDIGCFERLTPGDYRMYVTWTPRDGTSPVVASTIFEK